MKYKEITDGTRAMKSRWKECVDTSTAGYNNNNFYLLPSSLIRIISV